MWQQYLGFFPLSTNPWYFCKDAKLGRMSGKTQIASAASQNPDASSGTRGASSRRWDSLSSCMECVLHTARVRQSETSKMSRGGFQETSSHWAEVAAIEKVLGMAECEPWGNDPQAKERVIYTSLLFLFVWLYHKELGKAVNYHGPDVNKILLFSLQELFNLSEAFNNKKSYKASLANWSLATTCQPWLVDISLWGK